MKIITWNCNMAFRKKFETIISLQPDVLVLQECEGEAKLAEALKDVPVNQIFWYGNNPHKGTAVISFRDAELAPKHEHNPEYEFIVPYTLQVRNKTINLYNIWAMPHQTDRKKDYVGQIYGALHYYAEALQNESILIGDFNSNAIWDNKNKIGNHEDIVRILADHHIHSLYHQKNNIIPGKEPDPTLFLLKNPDKPYHMDYCFASQSLISKKTQIEVGAHKDWIKLSDHMPLIIDNLGPSRSV